MGNFISAGASIGVPLLTQLVTIPFLFHPHRWGGVPFKEPGWFMLSIVSIIINILTLMIIGTISGMMTTTKACRKIEVWRSIKRSMWVVAGYMFGNMIMWLLPFVKAPILPFMVMLPYGGWIVHGLFVSLSVLIFGAMGNTLLRAEVC